MTEQKKEEVKTKEQFYTAYQNLCKEYGYGLDVVPTYMKRDDGTFSTVVKVAIVELKPIA